MEGDSPETTVTNVCPVFTGEQLVEGAVLLHTVSMEGPMANTTLDHDALISGITTAYMEDNVDGQDYISVSTPQSEKGPVTMYPSRCNGFGALKALSLSILDP